MINIEKKLSILLRACFIDDFEFNGEEFIIDFVRDSLDNDEYNKLLSEAEKSYDYLYQYCIFKASDWWFGDKSEWNKKKESLLSNNNEALLAYHLGKTKYHLGLWIVNVEIIDDITYLYFVDGVKISINNLKAWSLTCIRGNGGDFGYKYDIICNNGIFQKTEDFPYIFGRD